MFSTRTILEHPTPNAALTSAGPISLTATAPSPTFNCTRCLPMRKRTSNPNASHNQVAAAVTSGYASTGIIVAPGIDLFESFILLGAGNAYGETSCFRNAPFNTQSEAPNAEGPDRRSTAFIMPLKAAACRPRKFPGKYR